MTKGVCGLVMEGIVELASSSKVTAGSLVLLQATDFCFFNAPKTCFQNLLSTVVCGGKAWYRVVALCSQ